MQSINSLKTQIHFNDNAYAQLKEHFLDNHYSKVFIIVDTNTRRFCLDTFIRSSGIKEEYHVIEIPEGEIYKTIETCQTVWNELSNLDADRKSIVLNLGGGVVTDLGAFVASTFKRGIAFINIPTSLLAMVDASIGGKTGVDLGVLKNQIGVINFPEMVIVDTTFLTTLPKNHFRSGLAEMLKHGLINDVEYWNKMNSYRDVGSPVIEHLIYESILIKHKIVSEDPYEKGLRKALNYGHTLGHAIESYFLSNDQKETLLHGEAIAIGMILETYLSNRLSGFPENSLNEVKLVIKELFGHVTINEVDYNPIIDLLKFDKKNSFGVINFVLLENFGKVQLDCHVPNDMILDAFLYYNV